jgi:hypothetical protein
LDIAICSNIEKENRKVRQVLCQIDYLIIPSSRTKKVSDLKEEKYIKS